MTRRQNRVRIIEPRAERIDKLQIVKLGANVYPTRRECLLISSGLDSAGAFVIREKDATRSDNAFRHLERRRDRALGKQAFPLAQSYRIDHQPEIIDQIMLHERLKQITASPNMEIGTFTLLEFGDFFRN